MGREPARCRPRGPGGPTKDEKVSMSNILDISSKALKRYQDNSFELCIV